MPAVLAVAPFTTVINDFLVCYCVAHPSPFVFREHRSWTLTVKDAFTLYTALFHDEHIAHHNEEIISAPSLASPCQVVTVALTFIVVILHA